MFIVINIAILTIFTFIIQRKLNTSVPCNSTIEFSTANLSDRAQNESDRPDNSLYEEISEKLIEIKDEISHLAQYECDRPQNLYEEISKNQNESGINCETVYSKVVKISKENVDFLSEKVNKSLSNEIE